MKTGLEGLFRRSTTAIRVCRIRSIDLADPLLLRTVEALRYRLRIAPATVMVSPEMCAASSDAKNATVAATSSGSPSLPKGMSPTLVLMCSPGASPSCSCPIAKSTGA